MAVALFQRQHHHQTEGSEVVSLPTSKGWESGYYGHVQPPVYSDIPNYTQYNAPVAGVICNQCLAVVQRVSADDHTRWHEEQRRMTVSTVLWCDSGNHAFKAGRPGSQSVQGSEINEEGISVSVQQDVCPECATAARKRRAVREIQAVKVEECPVCESNALVHNRKRGVNQCMECGWDSGLSAENPLGSVADK